MISTKKKYNKAIEWGVPMGEEGAISSVVERHIVSLNLDKRG